MEQFVHTPVMLAEILDYLQLQQGQVIVDGTLGLGGHSLEILKRIGATGRLIGIDRDQDSLKLAAQRLADFTQQATLVHGNFSDIPRILTDAGIEKIDGFIIDLGVSSLQLQDAQRGFSFQNSGPLDMRLDRTSYISAYDLVNNLTEEEISQLLWSFGQERWNRRIARFIVEQRKHQPISTTAELSDIVIKAIPPRFRRHYYKIHPATRTFQAIRIAVNRELEALEQVIPRVIEYLRPGARICVISFHSLEDRIVKLAFKAHAAEGKLKIITPKPITPKVSEARSNPSSRSAKLRVAERMP